MGKVIYSMGMSLDGYVEDPDGGIDFSAPDEEVHRLANEQAREASAFLFGRRMYEVMEGFWPQAASREDLPEVELEFARAYVETPRVVFSDTLAEVAGDARLVRSDAAVAEVTRLKQESDGHLDLGGATLAASLIDLIDEFRMWVNPVAVGGGKPFFPPAGGQLRLRLAEHRAFDSGTLYLRYERAS
ncbi:MAG TPA: dihydrofolate reductase family protein [Conexibacter sp.]|nr:dihydrofolate reductase family protein [Conexibacter sp.]